MVKQAILDGIVTVQYRLPHPVSIDDQTKTAAYPLKAIGSYFEEAIAATGSLSVGQS